MAVMMRIITEFFTAYASTQGPEWLTGRPSSGTEPAIDIDQRIVEIHKSIILSTPLVSGLGMKEIKALHAIAICVRESASRKCNVGTDIKKQTG
jgi:hypothetical protein